MTNDFLVEIHTEELPPTSLYHLGQCLLNSIKQQLDQASLTYTDGHFYATPRRLAVKIDQLISKQPDSIVERKGPATKAAYDAEGNPTPACIGFARSLQINPENLIILKSEQGEWVGHQYSHSGESVETLLPDIITQALKSLPIPKPMRWSDLNTEFVRPIHSIILLYGEKIIPAEILGLQSDRKTQGHRFHSHGWLSIPNPESYDDLLKNQSVIADFTLRRETIRQQIETLVKNTLPDNAKACISETLLEEVTGLVEWPVALLGHFDKTFLNVPEEALISAMQNHQRYFSIVNQQGALLPYFVTISNIKSKSPTQVIAGNERVLRARLSDAAFFFETDKKLTLEKRVTLLEDSIFQAKLGTLKDKALRLAKLTAYIADLLQLNSEQAHLAGLYAKTDLTTQLVSEFPELQGTAGFYYAKEEGLSETIATAIKEHYSPKFSGDNLPQSLLGCALALADRIDTLVGIFGINQIPSGVKDPFALRRAALGVLRILIEKKLNLNLEKLLTAAAHSYSTLENSSVVPQLLNFMIERLKPWYQDKTITSDVFAAVAVLNITNPYDFDCRIHAVHAFKKRPEAGALSGANKRVSNILIKEKASDFALNINPDLFEHPSEHFLAEKLVQHQKIISSLSLKENYTDILNTLANLREPIDQFFDHVLVMTDDKARRANRLLLLKQLRELFLHVADIALLQ